MKFQEFYGKTGNICLNFQEEIAEKIAGNFFFGKPPKIFRNFINKMRGCTHFKIIFLITLKLYDLTDCLRYI